MKAQFLIILFSLIIPLAIFSQDTGGDNIWTFEECIQYALKQNIQTAEERTSILAKLKFKKQ